MVFSHHIANATAFHTVRGDADPPNPYSQINCCDYTGDSPEHISESRKAVCHELGIDEASLITARQTHSTNVAIIDTATMQLTVAQRADRLNGVDALVTASTGIAIGVFTADCVPMVMFDPMAKVAAVAHAGWKGTLYNIAAATVASMVEMGASPSCIEVAFGPSICQECFEVGDEVASLFEEKGLADGGIIVRNSSTGKAHIDLVKANIAWLSAAGIASGNINPSSPCTKCNPMEYFSARNLGIASGRILTGIIMN